MPLFTVEVVALRTRKERQQGATWRGNYNEQRYKRLQEVKVLSALKTFIKDKQWDCCEDWSDGNKMGQKHTKNLYICGDFPSPDSHRKKVPKGKRPRWGQPWVTTLSRFYNILQKVFLSQHRNCESILSSMCMPSLKVLCTFLVIYFKERLI